MLISITFLTRNVFHTSVLIIFVKFRNVAAPLLQNKESLTPMQEMVFCGHIIKPNLNTDVVHGVTSCQFFQVQMQMTLY